MNTLIAFAGEALHVGLMLAAAPVLAAFIRWIEARLTGRSGPPLSQSWRELLRLARKQPVVAENASQLYRIAPVVCFAVIGLAASLVPSFTLGMAFAPLADLLVVLGLLALSRCVLALAGMDIGTSLGGVGASKTVEIAVLAEPALLLVVFTLALFAGSSSVEMIAAMRAEGTASWGSLGLSLAAIVLVAVADTERGPIRRGSTALGMVHGALVQDYSGCKLALLEAAAMLRLLVWLDLIGAMFLPFGMAPASTPLAWPLGLGCWLARTLVMATTLAVTEVLAGRMRLPRVSRLLACAMLFALLAAAFLFGGAGTA